MINRPFTLCTAIVLLLLCNTSCRQNKAGPKKKLPEVDFNTGSTINDFSVRTISGKNFDSRSCKGKYWVVFFYNKSTLSSNRHFSNALNQIAVKFKSKVTFIGVLNSFVENDKEVLQLFKNASFNFPQVDNTVSYERNARLNDNVFCTPAGIIIDTNGKVIHHVCGEAETLALEDKLSIILNRK